MGIKQGLQAAEAAAADRAIAEFFYANGISFKPADPSPDSYYKRMVKAIQAAPTGYVPPNFNKLAGPLLDTCHLAMEKEIRARDADGSKAAKFGVTYAQDGWDSVDHLPLINSAYITAGEGVYMKSVDTSGKTKNAEYVAALMIADIYELGCTNVVLVVTDTCAVMKRAWEFVLDEFPWISVIPCVPHVISLLMKDIGKISEVQALIKDQNSVVSWFSNHQKPLAIFRRKCRAVATSGCELIKAAATRFGTNTYVGERLLKVKTHLQATVIDEEYVNEGYKDLAPSVEESNCEVITRENKGGTVKNLVLSGDDSFWARVQENVKNTRPLCNFLRRHDSAAATVGKVYNGWFEVGKKLASSTSTYIDTVKEKHRERWDYCDASFFRAAYILDPEFADVDHSSNEEVLDGLMDVVEKLGILFEVRRHNSTFGDKWKARAKAIVKDPMAHRQWNNYPEYPTAQSEPVKEFCSKVMSQLSNYRNKQGIFAREWVMESAAHTPAHLWWDLNGSSVPELQSVARMVLAHPASASLVERINSEFAFIKDRNRNKLKHENANKLVGLFHNLRLLRKVKEPRYAEPAVGWADEVAESSGVYKYGVATYGA